MTPHGRKSTFLKKDSRDRLVALLVLSWLVVVLLVSSFSKNLFSENLNLRWPNGKGISQPKMKLMLHLIPNDTKSYYRKFFEYASIVNKIDSFNGKLDFETEATKGSGLYRHVLLTTLL